MGVYNFSGMKVQFKTSGGKSVALDCQPTDTISSVKEKLVGPLDIPVAQNRLIFKGETAC